MLFSLRKYKYNNKKKKKKAKKNAETYPKITFFWFFRLKNALIRDFLANFVR